MKVEIRKVSNGYIVEKPDGTVFVYRDEKELSERFGAYFEKQNSNAEGRLRIEGESVLADKLAELWKQLRKFRYDK